MHHSIIDITEDVVKYVDSIMCCQRSWDDQEMDNLITLQVHICRHTGGCKKGIRNSAVHRFDFFRYPIMKTQALEPLSHDLARSTT
jgi:hypothetical protein